MITRYFSGTTRKLGIVEIPALKLLNESILKGLKPSRSHYMDLLQHCVEGRNLKAGKSIYDSYLFMGFDPDLTVYTSMMQLYATNSKFTLILSTLAEMKDRGIKADIALMNAIIQVYSNLDNLGAISILYDRILEMGLHPNEKTFSLIMNVYAKQGDVKMVERLYHVMTKQKAPLEQTVESFRNTYLQPIDIKIVPTWLTRIELLKAYIASQQYTKAVFVLREYSKQNLATEEMFDLLMNKFSKHDYHSVNRCISLFYDAQDAGILDSQDILEGPLIIMFRNKMVDEINDWMTRFGDRSFKPSPYLKHVMIRYCLKSHQLDKAISIFQSMPSMNGTYAELIVHVCKESKKVMLPKYDVILRELWEGYQTHRSNQKRTRKGPTRLYHWLFNYFVVVGSSDLAQQVLVFMLQDRVTPRSDDLLLYGELKLKDQPWSEDLLLSSPFQTIVRPSVSNNLIEDEGYQCLEKSGLLDPSLFSKPEFKIDSINKFLMDPKIESTLLKISILLYAKSVDAKVGNIYQIDLANHMEIMWFYRTVVKMESLKGKRKGIGGSLLKRLMIRYCALCEFWATRKSLHLLYF